MSVAFVEWYRVIPIPFVTRVSPGIWWNTHRLPKQRFRNVSLSHGGIVDLAKVYYLARFSRLFPDDMHPAAPWSGCIGGNPLNYTQIYVPFQLPPDLIHPMGWYY